MSLYSGKKSTVIYGTSYQLMMMSSEELKSWRQRKINLSFLTTILFLNGDPEGQFPMMIKQMTKNKRFVSLSAFFKVAQVQGSCITLSSVAPNGMLGNEIFTVHANYCRIVTQDLIEQIADIDPETINKRVSDKYIVRKI